MKKWSLVGILGISLFALCLGSIVAFVPVVNQVFSGNLQWNLFSIRNISADTVEELRAPVDGPAELKIDTPFGKVYVEAEEGSSEILISAHKYAWGSNQQAAEDLLTKIDVILEQDGNSVNVYVDQPVQVDIFHIGPAGISVDFTVSVPVECDVEASSASGDIRLSGIRGAASVRSSFGDVTAEDVDGKTTAKTSSGDVTVKRIRAVKENIEASSSFGDVEILDSEGDSLTAKTSSGNVTVEDSVFTARADLSSNFGDVEATDMKASAVEARTNSGKVVLRGLEVEDSLTAHSDFGDVEVLESSAERYDLDTNSGKVTAEDTQGKVKARSGFGDIEIRGTNVTLDLSTSSGSIDFSGSLGDGTSTLHTNFGDIRVRLPKDAQFRLDLSTNFGDVECGFSVQTTKSSSTHLVGTVGDGGPMLDASTNSGDVNVRPQASE